VSRGMLAAAVAPLTGSNETTIIVSVRLPACPRRKSDPRSSTVNRPSDPIPTGGSGVGLGDAVGDGVGSRVGAGVGRGVGGSVGDGLGELAIATTAGVGRRTRAAAAVALTSAATKKISTTRDRGSANRARLSSMPGRYHPRPHQTAVPTSWFDLDQSRKRSGQIARPRHRYGAAA